MTITIDNLLMSIRSKLLWTAILILFKFQLYSQNTNNSSFLSFDLMPVDTFYLTKMDPRDLPGNFAMTVSGDFAYYSRYKKCIQVYNYKTKSTKYYYISFLNRPELIDFYPVLEKITFIDSERVILLFDANYFQFQDDCLLKYNYKTGIVENHYNFSGSGFINRNDFSKDTLKRKNKAYSNYTCDYYSDNNYWSYDSSVLIAIQGSNKPMDGLNFSQKPSIIRVFPGQSTPCYPLKITLNDATTCFNNFTKTGPIGGYNNFLVDYTFRDESNIVISYPFSHELFNYNLKTDSVSKLSNYPEFINFDGLTLPDSITSITEHVSYGSMFLTGNKKYALRKIKFPVLDNTFQNSLRPNTAALILLDSNFKAIGIQSKVSIEKGIILQGVCDKEMFFSYNSILSNKNITNHVLVRYRIADIEKESGIFQFPYPTILNKKQRITNYLKTVGTGLELLDTVPVIFIRGVCQSCLIQTSTFLKNLTDTAKNNPFIIVFPNIGSGNIYFRDNKLMGLHNVFIDSNNLFSEYLLEPGKMGLLVRKENDFEFVGLDYNSLAIFFLKINSNKSLISKICAPVKEY